MSPELVEQNVAELERELVAEAEATAAEGAKLAVAMGLAAEPAVARGARQPWEPILAAAAEREADVVVCGSRGRGAVARSVLGSTSSSLLHHAQRSVLIVPEAETLPDGPALIAYDGSPAAREAIAAAGRLLPGRPALVVHAWESPFRRSASGRALSRLSAPRDPRGHRRPRDVAARDAPRKRSRKGWSWHGPPGSRRPAKPSSRDPPPGGSWRRRRRPATPRSSSPARRGTAPSRRCSSARSPPGWCITRSGPRSSSARRLHSAQDAGREAFHRARAAVNLDGRGPPRAGSERGRVGGRGGRPMSARASKEGEGAAEGWCRVRGQAMRQLCSALIAPFRRAVRQSVRPS